MAFEQNLQSISLVAAADLSAKIGYIVQVDSNGKAALADATALAVGVLQNNPASGQVATVGVHGVSKVVAGGTIAAGARVTSDANGKAIAATTAGDAVIGIALAGAAANDIIPILLTRMPFAALA